MNVRTLIVVFTTTFFTIQGNPPSYSVYDVMKRSENDPLLKCPYLRNTSLLQPEPTFLFQCSNFTSATSFTKLSVSNVDDALCLVYFDSFEHLCAVSNSSEIIKKYLPNDPIKRGITAYQANGEEVCTILKNVSFFTKESELGLNIIRKSFQNTKVCVRMCTDLDDTVKPICSLTALMINVTSKIENQASLDIKTEKSPVAQTKPVFTVSNPDGPTNAFKTHTNMNSSNGKLQTVQENENFQSSIRSNKVNPGTEESSVTVSTIKDKAHIDNVPVNTDHHLNDHANTVQQPKILHPQSRPTEKLSSSSLGEQQTESGKSAIPGKAAFAKAPNKINQTMINELQTKDKAGDAVPKVEATSIDMNLIGASEKSNAVKSLSPEGTDFEGKQEKSAEDSEHIQQVLPAPVGDGDDFKGENEADKINKLATKLEDAGKDNPGDSIQNRPFFSDDPNDIEPGYTNEGDYGVNEGRPKDNEDARQTKPSEQFKPLETDEDGANFAANYQNQNIDDSDSYFFSYFMMVCIMFICGYVAYHNKQKIVALVVEGRKGRRSSRTRRPNSANYRKLDSNLEEAVTSSCQKNATQKVSNSA